MHFAFQPSGRAGPVRRRPPAQLRTEQRSAASSGARCCRHRPRLLHIPRTLLQLALARVCHRQPTPDRVQSCALHCLRLEHANALGAANLGAGDGGPLSVGTNAREGHCSLSIVHCLLPIVRAHVRPVNQARRSIQARPLTRSAGVGTPHPCVQGGPSPQHSRPPGCSPSSLMPAAISTPSSARLARRGAPNRLCAVVRASNRCRPPWASARAWACEIGRRRKGSYLRHSSQRSSVVAGGPETRFDRTPGPPCSGEAGSRCFVPSGATLYRRPTHQPHTLRNSLYLALRPPSTLLESCAPPWLFRLA